MNMELQRQLFEAENKYISYKTKRDEMLSSFKKFFLMAVGLLFVGSCLPFFMLKTSDPEINKLVGLATGCLVLVALLTLVLALAHWRNVSHKQLLESESQLIAAQKSFVQTKIANITQGNLIELGFPRDTWLRNAAKLGDTIAENRDGVSQLFELYYDPDSGYSLIAKELEVNHE